MFFRLTAENRTIYKQVLMGQDCAGDWVFGVGNVLSFLNSEATKLLNSEATNPFDSPIQHYVLTVL